MADLTGNCNMHDFMSLVHSISVASSLSTKICQPKNHWLVGVFVLMLVFSGEV